MNYDITDKHIGSIQKKFVSPFVLILLLLCILSRTLSEWPDINTRNFSFQELVESQTESPDAWFTSAYSIQKPERSGRRIPAPDMNISTAWIDFLFCNQNHSSVLKTDPVRKTCGQLRSNWNLRSPLFFFTENQQKRKEENSYEK